MTEIRFYENVDDELLKFAVIISKPKENHKERYEAVII